MGLATAGIRAATAVLFPLVKKVHILVIRKSQLTTWVTGSTTGANITRWLCNTQDLFLHTINGFGLKFTNDVTGIHSTQCSFFLLTRYEDGKPPLAAVCIQLAAASRYHFQH